jgi:hypothetical protein
LIQFVQTYTFLFHFQIGLMPQVMVPSSPSPVIQVTISIQRHISRSGTHKTCLQLKCTLAAQLR